MEPDLKTKISVLKSGANSDENLQLAHEIASSIIEKPQNAFSINKEHMDILTLVLGSDRGFEFIHRLKEIEASPEIFNKKFRGTYKDLRNNYKRSPQKQNDISKRSQLLIHFMEQLEKKEPHKEILTFAAKSLLTGDELPHLTAEEIELINPHVAPELRKDPMINAQKQSSSNQTLRIDPFHTIAEMEKAVEDNKQAVEDLKQAAADMKLHRSDQSFGPSNSSSSKPPSTASDRPKSQYITAQNADKTIPQDDTKSSSSSTSTSQESYQQESTSKLTRAERRH